MVDRWKKISSKQVADYRIFQVHENVSESPVTGEAHTFYALHSRDWTNVVAVTPENRVVMVRQYRHGIDEISLEIPAGRVETNDPTPEATIRRELLEETGYEADEVIYLGAVHANPAFLDNMCRTFLARDAQRISKQDLEDTEDIHVEEIDLDVIPAMIMSGAISHSLSVAAFYLFEQYQKQSGSL